MPSRSSLIMIAGFTAIAALALTGCGTGMVDGMSNLQGDAIYPEPVGPYNKMTGDYVLVVENVSEHGIDDSFFFMSAFNFNVGDTSWVSFDNANVSDGLWATAELTFANATTDVTQWSATDSGTIVYAAPFPYLHSDGIIEDFEFWDFAAQWAATIKQGTSVELKYNVIAISDAAAGSGTGWNIDDFGLWGWGTLPENVDVASTGEGTTAGAVFTLYPRPTVTQLGPFAGTYHVTGNYTASSESEMQEVSFDFVLNDDGTVTTSLTGDTTFFCYLRQGFNGTVITGQASGPAIAAYSPDDWGYDDYYWWSWYDWWYGYYDENELFAPPLAVPGASGPFTTTYTLDENDKVTQKIEMVVSYDAGSVSGGLFQQAIDVFPEGATLDQERLQRTQIGPRIAFTQVAKN